MSVVTACTLTPMEIRNATARAPSPGALWRRVTNGVTVDGTRPQPRGALSGLVRRDLGIDRTRVVVERVVQVPVASHRAPTAGASPGTVRGQGGRPAPPLGPPPTSVRTGAELP